jgi:hypothetical protein
MKFYAILILVLLSIGENLKAQVLADFETDNPSLSLATQTGDHTAIINNPDVGGNSSTKVAYYRKASGNWRAILLNFLMTQNTGQNDELSFKIRSSTQGRVFVKLIKQGITIFENWAPDYTSQPVVNQWVTCKLSIASVKNTDFDRIEVNGSVDNNAVADVFLDDFKLSNSKSPNGEPIIGFVLSSYEIEAGQSILFDASSSFDLEGSIQSFHWKFGDNTSMSGAQVEHTFGEDGVYNIVLSITDNEGKSNSRQFSINVFPAENRIGRLTFLKKNISTHEKIEAVFLIKGNYSNVYNPDEIQVDAIITLPDQKEIVVPCFYFQQVDFRPDQWYRTEEEGHWRLRFSAAHAGLHQVKIQIKDPLQTHLSTSYTVLISQGSTKGYVRMDKTNRQYYRHTTGEPFQPLGINIAWNTTSNYAAIFKNLAKGGANLVRYWQAPFDRQGLEWKNGNGFYKGLGIYSQEAAAEQDSIFGLCEFHNMYLQPVLFQHGMFSENVDSNWIDNPYNIENGGPLTKAEQFFYNAQAKAYAKKLLRYIVARWGYSRHLFSWELFNEVNFTGQHPNQSSAWYPGVLTWHNEMGLHVKSLDAFDHLVSTSSDDSHLQAMDKLEGLDNVQYHLYNTDLLKTQLTNDKLLLNKLTRTGLINGEYGLDVNTADVPFDDQRIAIWTGIFSQVPRLMWKWENYVSTNWSDIFSRPASYLENKDFVSEGSITRLELKAKFMTQDLGIVGFKTNAASYAFAYDKAHRNSIATATVDLSTYEAGNYSITYTNILDGEEQTETVDLVDEKAFRLPTFSKGIAFRAVLNYPIVVGLDLARERNIFSFYPNPSHDQIQIDATLISGESEISIFNLMGVLSGKLAIGVQEPLSEDTVSINLNSFSLSPGVYLLRLKTPTGIFNAKMIYQ